MTDGIWRPQNDIFIDYNSKLCAPAIPKSAYSTLKVHVFNVFKSDEPGLVTHFRGQLPNTYPDSVPDNFDCIVTVRDPLDRLISGIAEVMYRKFKRDSGLPEKNFSRDVDSFILNFLYTDKTKNLECLLTELSTTSSEAHIRDIHLRSQTELMDWKKFAK